MVGDTSVRLAALSYALRLARYRTSVVVGIAISLVWTNPADAACKVAKIAELPVTLIGRRAIADAKFGVHDARFIVDSGAFYSTLSKASATDFGLTLEPTPSWFSLRGVNGEASAYVGKAKNFTIAGVTLPSVDFIVGGSDTGTAGLLGQNILGIADTEYDLPHGAVRLMRAEGCANTGLAYWAAGKPFSEIVLERGAGGPWKPHTIGTVIINGVKLRATFDSGAQTSTMTLSAAKRLGVTPTSPGVVPLGTSSGIGSKQLSSWLAQFDTIDLGGEIVPKPKFRIAPLEIDTDMLIGFDFFLTHRIFVSNADHRLFMTYEGGSFFGLRPTGARASNGEKLDLTDKAPEPTDAEGFARRGAVSMSNRRIAEGLADLDKAVSLAPNEGHYLYMRGEAHLAAGQTLLAGADLDKAAILMPEDPDVRLTRARLRLVNRDPQGALDDARAADHGLPPNSDRRLQLGALFDALDQPDLAIPNFDAWLKMHGDDADRASAYNGRCWSRALLNRDLPKALSDCNTAVRLRPTSATYLEHLPS